MLAVSVASQGAPAVRGKKGLQVQDVEDALRLGIDHAALNVQLGHLLLPVADEGAPEAGALVDGWRLDPRALRSLDDQVRPLAAADVELTFILLARATGRPELDARLLDPRYDPGAPNRLGAWRVLDEAGRSLLRPLLAALAQRYGPGSEVGRVRNWIVGNEVNSHWWWHNLGRAGLDEVVEVYEPAVRLVHEAVSPRDPDARVFVSLEHHWARRFAAGEPNQSLGGRALLEAFAARARARGDFPWHVAYHPYPEDLFDCRFWEDESAWPTPDTPRITFRNLEVLTTFLERDALLWNGAPRRVLLSEQGFHCRDGPTGEEDQRRAFALAWRKVQALDGVDALIYHRHVDHAHEGGLRLGLRERVGGSVCDPGRARPLWELFRACGTPDEVAAIEAALAAPEPDRR